MEENLTLAELDMILDAAREREMRANKFAAALKGIRLDDQDGEREETPEERFNRVVREAKAMATGKTTEEVEFQEDELGFGFEIEEEE